VDDAIPVKVTLVAVEDLRKQLVYYFVAKKG
jgi:hypothetical protein